MKRLIAAVLIVLFATGCGAAQMPSDAMAGAFCLTADYQIDRVKGTLVYEQDGAGFCTLVFLSPDTVNGLRLTLKDGVVTTCFLDVTTEGMLEDLSPHQPMRLLFESALALYRETQKLRSEDEVSVFSLESGARFYFKEDIPIKIEYPSAQLELTILEFNRTT